MLWEAVRLAFLAIIRNKLRSFLTVLGVVIAFNLMVAVFLLVLGAPLRRADKLYNCAVVIAHGQILGVVPKSFLPNYREFYEKRHFAHGRGCTDLWIGVAGEEVPFGTDLVFAAANLPGFRFGVEICEDFWAPIPPGMTAALAGALILCNLSASPVTIGRADDRHLHCRSSASRAIAAYVYSASGYGESTTDLAWDGQGVIYEMSGLLAQSERFDRSGELTIVDIDTERLAAERLRNQTFADAAEWAGRPDDSYRRIVFEHAYAEGDIGLVRPVARFPFVPDRPEKLDEDCYEAFNIQVDALMRRIESTAAKSLVIGISGGLDSTHALIVAAKACDRLGMPRTAIRGYTMPGFGTSDGTKTNAHRLMEAMEITPGEIDIRPAANKMLEDIGHAFANGEPVHDVTFENVQAGLRTDYLFRLAGQHGGFVVGTGDLSELALGWCTYGVGDHMSHYGVNAGVPKTLIQYLIRWVIRTGQFTDACGEVLSDVLGTEISPELVPPGADAVVMQEQCDALPAQNAGELGQVRVNVLPQHGQWIRRRGEDVLLDYASRQADVSDLFAALHHPAVYARLLPLLVGLAAWTLGITGLPLTVMVVAAALPMGANVFLFAQRYEVAQELTTAAMGLSTVLALFTLSLVMAQ